MFGSNIKRLEKEVGDLQSESTKIIPVNISLGPSLKGHSKEQDLYKWDASILGELKTPYEGGKFDLEIIIPKDYPFSPPKVKFKTKIYHPNISDAGDICLDILKGNWSPALTVQKVVMSIASLLTDPNPKDPLRGDAATLFLQDRKSYDNKVREYVRKYASS